MEKKAPVLTITGSDSSGGSGIQADIKTISALGGYAASAITSVTVQNTLGIQDVFDLPVDIIIGQIQAVMDDLEPHSVKVGMVRNAQVIETIAELFKKHAPRFVVYDPVVVSSQGKVLMDDALITHIENRLFPLCTVVTLKKEAAEFILHHSVSTIDDFIAAAFELLDMGSQAILLQGCQMAAYTMTDVLVVRDNQKPLFFSTPGFIDRNTHGVGGTLSSAIATYLSQGHDISTAVEKARNYINQLIVYSLDLQIGHGGGLLDHAGQASQSTISSHFLARYNAFMDEIAAHYKSNSDVAFYADKLHVTSRYLAQITRLVAGKSPKELIQEYLIKEIEIQLISSAKNVQEIAFDFGFRSQAQFTKFFHRKKGCSPSEYRLSK